MKKIRNFWKNSYSIIIAFVFSIGYSIFLYLNGKNGGTIELLQNSKNFCEMLKAVVTFSSIILSVFGFLIPSFLSSKGKDTAVSYFIENADMKLFSVKLKNVVISGLATIFLSTILLAYDIVSNPFMVNAGIVCWIWILFYFMCSSYRFISIIINLIILEKEKVVQKIGNEISDKEKEELDKQLTKI